MTSVEDKPWPPNDRFYEGYSFSNHFGYGPQDEYRRIEAILAKSGLSPSDEDVKMAMYFVNAIAKETKRIGPQELQAIDSIAIREKIVGGDVPSAILFGWEMLRVVSEGVIAGAVVTGAKQAGSVLFNRLKEKITGKHGNDGANLINDEIFKLALKIIEDEKSIAVISMYSEKLSLRIAKDGSMVKSTVKIIRSRKKPSKNKKAKKKKGSKKT